MRIVDKILSYWKHYKIVVNNMSIFSDHKFKEDQGMTGKPETMVKVETEIDVYASH